MERDSPHPDEILAAEQVHAYVESVLSGEPPALPAALEADHIATYILAMDLATSRPGADAPPHDLLARVNARIAQRTAAPTAPRPMPRSRPAPTVSRRGLTTAAGVAASVLVGVALDRAVAGLGQPAQDHSTQMDLVGPDGLWYDVAATSAVPPGAVRRFSAGGIDGFLVNDGGSLYAVSAICTHMGCHVRWNAAHRRFDCLCHNASYGRRGEVLGGRPLRDLPRIHTRELNGRIYVWGTSWKSWG